MSMRCQPRVGSAPALCSPPLPVPTAAGTAQPHAPKARPRGWGGAIPRRWSHRRERRQRADSGRGTGSHPSVAPEVPVPLPDLLQVGVGARWELRALFSGGLLGRSPSCCDAAEGTSWRMSTTSFPPPCRLTGGDALSGVLWRPDSSSLVTGLGQGRFSARVILWVAGLCSAASCSQPFVLT